jgi:hypothetical protein
MPFKPGGSTEYQPDAAQAPPRPRFVSGLRVHGDLASAEPKRLRYRVLHAAGRLTHGQRHRWLRIPSTWPWAEQIAAAFTRITGDPRTRLTNPDPAPTTGGAPGEPRPPPRQTAHRPYRKHNASINSDDDCGGNTTGVRRE